LYFTWPVFSETQYSAPVWGYLLGQAKAVPRFTVLSGFLIYRAVLAIGSLEGLRIYIIRRIFRIYPVYVLGIALSLGFGLYADGTNFSRLSHALSDLFMFPIIGWTHFNNPEALVRFNAENIATNLVIWSLFVEVTFYAVLPLFVVLVGRRRIVAASLIALAIVLLAESTSRSFGLWKYFLIGILASELAPRLRWASAPAFALGMGLLVLDFMGPEYDWGTRFGLANGRTTPAGETLGLGVASGLILAALPNLGRIGKALDLAPLRLLGAISYSVFIVHPFFILANFPELGVFSNFRNLTEHFKALPAMPAWYLPFVFLPGALWWGLVSFVLVERPGIRFGKWLVGRSRMGPMLQAQSRPIPP
jgi:peptidoglycan/LPS O-acetylase OafA/YrhL